MKNKGFTLIELLAVIVIIAIIATIGIYSVTKIMAKSRLDSLTATALSAKRVAVLYSAQNDLAYGNTVLHLEKGGMHANLMDIGKDPWGKDYSAVTVVIAKADAGIQIQVYIETASTCYLLGNGETKVDVSEPCLGSLAYTYGGGSVPVETASVLVNFADNITPAYELKAGWPTDVWGENTTQVNYDDFESAGKVVAIQRIFWDPHNPNPPSQAWIGTGATLESGATYLITANLTVTGISPPMLPYSVYGGGFFLADASGGFISVPGEQCSDNPVFTSGQWQTMNCTITYEGQGNEEVFIGFEIFRYFAREETLFVDWITFEKQEF